MVGVDLYLLGVERDDHRPRLLHGNGAQDGAGLFPDYPWRGCSSSSATISVIRSFVVPGTPIGGFSFKGLVLVILSTLIFGFLVRGAGLIVALPLLVIISAYAQHALPLAHDARDGVRADALLRFGVY